MKFYLMRHGETLFNTQKRVQGWCDSPLTEKGQDQARQVRAYFEKHDMTFDQYHCRLLKGLLIPLNWPLDRLIINVLRGLKKCTSVFLGVNRSIFIPRHLLRGILGTTMPSLVGKVKISL